MAGTIRQILSHASELSEEDECVGASLLAIRCMQPTYTRHRRQAGSYGLIALRAVFTESTLGLRRLLRQAFEDLIQALLDALVDLLVQAHDFQLGAQVHFEVQARG